MNETIAAMATPPGPAGIGVVRLSGPAALHILLRVFVPNKKAGPDSTAAESEPALVSHRIYYGRIHDPASGAFIDEALAFYMKQPHSFTREDVAEIQSHGGMVNMDRILGAVMDAGAVLAAPGEFTKRAFLHGRIDLSQAESVIDLIHAPCEAAARIASIQLTGAFRDSISDITTLLVTLRSRCEAGIEFEDTDAVDAESCLPLVRETLVQELIPHIRCLLQRHAETAIYKNGLVLVIAGAPNVGKSSLMNLLVDQEVSIVSEFPGTTRDLLKEYLSLDGIPVVACDTAGIHDTVDPVEAIGIARAMECIDRADVVLFVVDATRGLRSFEKDFLLTHGPNNVIAVINKTDCCSEEQVHAIAKEIPPGVLCVKTVATTGHGLDALKKAIVRQVAAGALPPSALSAGIPNLRHKKILEQVEAEMEACVAACDTHLPLDMISDLINAAISRIGEISGQSDQHEIYDEIFSRFCIGK
ncbi:tRNA uridine-5-carboxymethylaminomethyl(34) synthesis GTPase MnmE [Desulfosarcina sp. OttesenSCG-928-A07]|nr:tRNA uridine-5-carboxymethylaminomethyl(34) synthesis GTPase MnmE [Desulfosarcina sp. OttesenSCG-928-G17]MDL2328686.1 tRNA uridine-5-carboxymethylaminomethyl(34) synthesis GTPase MnmE [Desulfosarcina sp. OttesenSCG-928-A07]